jgi:hypothetical protein
MLNTALLDIKRRQMGYILGEIGPLNYFVWGESSEHGETLPLKRQTDPDTGQLADC